MYACARPPHRLPLPTGVILSSAPGGIDLDAHIPAKGRLLLGGEEPPSDAQVMVLAAEIVNTQVRAGEKDAHSRPATRVVVM